MLAIRMQRTGRKGHAEFRIIVQESRRTPTSGAIVSQLGHYNPHAKTVVIDKEKVSFYLDHGAQPSDSVVRLLQKEAITLPSWVKLATTQTKSTRHPEKLRKNQPAKPDEPTAADASETVAEPTAEVEPEIDVAEEAPAEAAIEPVAEEVAETTTELVAEAETVETPAEDAETEQIADTAETETKDAADDKE